jgi:hypothetical protein
MAPKPRAIAAAEQRLVQSRRALHEDLRRLGVRISRPQVLAGAAMVGALLGRSPMRRTRMGALATMLATALIRRCARQLFSTAV